MQYVNIEKARGWARSMGLRLPVERAQGGPDTNYITQDDLPAYARAANEPATDAAGTKRVTAIDSARADTLATVRSHIPVEVSPHEIKNPDGTSGESVQKNRSSVRPSSGRPGKGEINLADYKQRGNDGPAVSRADALAPPPITLYR